MNKDTDVKQQPSQERDIFFPYTLDENISDYRATVVMDCFPSIQGLGNNLTDPAVVDLSNEPRTMKAIEEISQILKAFYQYKKSLSQTIKDLLALRADYPDRDSSNTGLTILFGFINENLNKEKEAFFDLIDGAFCKAEYKFLKDEKRFLSSKKKEGRLCNEGLKEIKTILSCEETVVLGPEFLSPAQTEESNEVQSTALGSEIEKNKIEGIIEKTASTLSALAASSFRAQIMNCIKIFFSFFRSKDNQASASAQTVEKTDKKFSAKIYDPPKKDEELPPFHGFFVQEDNPNKKKEEPIENKKTFAG